MNKLSLSAPRQRLVEEMQRINFGHIENITVADREPCWENDSRIVQNIVLGKSNGPTSQHGQQDFALKQKVTELFDLFDREGSLDIERLEVQHGLPFRVLIRKQVASLP